MRPKFILLELFVVAAIIGTLAYVAQPAAPISYITKARVGEGVALVENIATRISSYAQTHQRLPDTLDGEYFKLPANSPAASAIESVSWHPAQLALRVALRPRNVFGDGKYIVFSASGALDNLQWRCGTRHPLAGDRPIPDAYLPTHCRPVQ